jgi:hypothetical protein
MISFLEKNGSLIKPLTMKGRTGSDGVVVIGVKRPVPPRLSVFIWWVYPCTDVEEFPMQEIVDDGVVAPRTPTPFKKVEKWCTADSQAPQPQIQPGKIIFLVHPMNRFV